MSRRIIASGTSEPDRIVLSALMPAIQVSTRTIVEAKGIVTERSLILDIVAEQISGTDSRELGEALKEPVCLRALSNTGGSD
jgi:hypothetical protein